MSSNEANSATAPVRPSEQKHDVLPTLFGEGYGIYEVRKESFVASFILNTSILALLVWVGSWTATHVPQIKQQMLGPAVEITPYIGKVDKQVSGGGGGGGSHDKLPASQGNIPKPSKAQIAPPMVIRPENPKLAVPPSVVAPPDLNLSQSPQMGDPLSKVLTASNGSGVGGGIGAGSGGGVGSGSGPGVGPGHGGGYGGGAYHVGGGVSAPRIIYKIDPEFSDEARKNKWQGTVVLKIIVGADGRCHDISVLRSLGLGLDEKAIEAVRQWRFEPGRKEGQAVPVEISVEATFHLY